MKNLILVTLTCMICFVATGQEKMNNKKVNKDLQTVKYCAMIKDGKVIVMSEKKEVTSDITLSSGIIIKSDGTVIRSDRSYTTLRIGECVDNETIIINPKDNDTFNREMDRNQDLAKTK